MSDFIEIKDKRGVKIFCSKSQWENHIVSESGHPIMRDNIYAVEETLRAPDIIYESHDSDPPGDYREVFSKEVESATYHSKQPYTKVVVSVVGGSGEVITAYPAKNPRGGTQGEAIYRAGNEN
ncbi:MAG: hypothetical protein K2O93_09400 [Oscillospiraceae bacterium]|nr:hypothetical protein [Oscillospiraceae bacterium]